MASDDWGEKTPNMWEDFKFVEEKTPVTIEPIIKPKPQSAYDQELYRKLSMVTENHNMANCYFCFKKTDLRIKQWDIPICEVCLVMYL